MTSPSLDCTHDQSTSGVARHHLSWTTHTIGNVRRGMTSPLLRQHTRSNDVGRGMPSSPLGSTHGRTTSGVACHHRLWASRRVGRRQAWHDITTLRQNTWSNDVGCCITSPPLDCTHDQSTLGVARHQRSWTTHTVGNIGRRMTSSPLDSTHGQQRRAWHAITALGQLTWSDDVGCGMTSPPLDGTKDQTTSGVACHHHLWEAHTIN